MEIIDFKYSRSQKFLAFVGLVFSKPSLLKFLHVCLMLMIKLVLTSLALGFLALSVCFLTPWSFLFHLGYHFHICKEGR